MRRGTRQPCRQRGQGLRAPASWVRGFMRTSCERCPERRSPGSSGLSFAIRSALSAASAAIIGPAISHKRWDKNRISGFFATRISMNNLSFHEQSLICSSHGLSILADCNISRNQGQKNDQQIETRLCRGNCIGDRRITGIRSDHRNCGASAPLRASAGLQFPSRSGLPSQCIRRAARWSGRQSGGRSGADRWRKRGL